jgi:hypothetical protein
LNKATIYGREARIHFLQIYFTDFFLGYEFRNYGLEVLSLTANDEDDRIGDV